MFLVGMLLVLLCWKQSRQRNEKRDGIDLCQHSRFHARLKLVNVRDFIFELLRGFLVATRPCLERSHR